jgi:hypothetical protein
MSPLSCLEDRLWRARPGNRIGVPVGRAPCKPPGSLSHVPGSHRAVARPRRRSLPRFSARLPRTPSIVASVMSEDKAAIITAGGSGIGAGAARRLAANGFHVAMLSSSRNGSSCASGSRCAVMATSTRSKLESIEARDRQGLVGVSRARSGPAGSGGTPSQGAGARSAQDGAARAAGGVRPGSGRGAPTSSRTLANREIQA